MNYFVITTDFAAAESVFTGTTTVTGATTAAFTAVVSFVVTTFTSLVPQDAINNATEANTNVIFFIFLFVFCLLLRLNHLQIYKKIAFDIIN